MLKFANTRFVTSALKPEEFPLLKNSQGKILPEIAVVGKSNVGKSTLLNVLFRKKLVKTSSTPGKTQRINFFLADEELLFVDLPGYGFSKAPQEDVMSWSSAIEDYLNERKSLRLLLLLVDVRRGVSSEDQTMIDWCFAKKIALLIVFTKCDKLSQTELTSIVKSFPTDSICFSKTSEKARKDLIYRINKSL